MASQQQLKQLATVGLQKARGAGHMDEATLIETAALHLHSLHKTGNAEGRAKVQELSWKDVAPTWQSRYRNLVRSVL